MARDINRQPYDEATLTKLDIFEQYLRAWLPVFVHTASAEAVMICDFCAGSGQDSDGVPGSPLRILRTVETYRGQIAQRKMSIRVLFNERLAGKLAQLQVAVAELKKAPWVSISFCREDFQPLFYQQYTQLQQQPNLLFIDQYGVKQVTTDIFLKLLELDKTDFLFFISSSFVKRFATTPEFRRHLPDLNPTLITHARHENVHRVMLNYFRGHIPLENGFQLYPFTLKKGSNIYGLVFGSKHPLGVEKFLDLAWDKNRVNGEANFDIDGDIEKSQPRLFKELEAPTKCQIFESNLEAWIVERGEVSNRDVYLFALANGHPKSHASACVRRLKREGKVECDGRIGFSYGSCIKGNPEPKMIRAIRNG